MGFSFNPALPTDKDKVRFNLGDTVDAGHRVEDETILAILATPYSVGITTAIIARSIAASFASKVDKEIGKTRLAMSQAYEHWRDLAAFFEASGGSSDGSGVMTATPMHVGGVSESERTELATGDLDRIPPSFAVGQDDKPTQTSPFPPYDPTRGP